MTTPYHLLPHRKKLAFVIGTGRCGSQSMEYLLKQQHNIFVEHEVPRCHWEFGQYDFEHILIYVFGCLNLFKSTDLVILIGYFFLSYIKKILKHYPETRVICIKRPMKETIRSIEVKLRHHRTCAFTSKNSQIWKDKDLTEFRTYFTFPHFDMEFKEGVVAYWNLYYSTADQLAKQFPNNFRVYDMDSLLNDEIVQREGLTFLGIPEDKVLVKTGIKLARKNYADWTE